jgi:serine/threonine protein kinase
VKVELLVGYAVLALSTVLIVLRLARGMFADAWVRRVRDLFVTLASPGPAIALALAAAATRWPPAIVGAAIVLGMAWHEARAASGEGEAFEEGLSSEMWIDRVLKAFPDGRYSDPRPVGKGGMARVFRVADQRLQRDVAFKLMDPEVVGDAAMRARFVREGRAMAALHHPGLPSVHDVADSPIPYMVMSFIEGQTLADRFEERGPASSAEVRDWVVQAARALGHAHQAGIVHRDVKPENLMLDDAGRVWVIDFGIARRAGQEAITRVGTIMGTPLFLPPEQLGGSEPEARNDIYSLGATAYFLLTGDYPYEMQELVAGVAGQPKPLPDSVEKELGAALTLMVNREPEARPASMLALLELVGK